MIPSTSERMLRNPKKHLKDFYLTGLGLEKTQNSRNETMPLNRRILKTEGVKRKKNRRMSLEHVKKDIKKYHKNEHKKRISIIQEEMEEIKGDNQQLREQNKTILTNLEEIKKLIEEQGACTCAKKYLQKHPSSRPKTESNIETVWEMESYKEGSVEEIEFSEVDRESLVGAKRSPKKPRIVITEQEKQDLYKLIAKYPGNNQKVDIEFKKLTNRNIPSVRTLLNNGVLKRNPRT